MFQNITCSTLCGDYNISETKLIEAFVSRMRERIPSQWSLCKLEELPEEFYSRSKVETDAILELRDPQGLSTAIAVEAKLGSVEPKPCQFYCADVTEADVHSVFRN